MTMADETLVAETIVNGVTVGDEMIEIYLTEWLSIYALVTSDCWLAWVGASLHFICWITASKNLKTRTRKVV